MNVERKRHEFQKMKKVVQRKFKGCEIKHTPAGFTIQQDGRNVVSSEWPDLQHADSVYDAYHNAFTSEFWTRQYNKKPKKVAACIVNMVGDDSNMPDNKPTIDKESKSKVKIDEEVFDEMDYSRDRMEDWG